MITGGSEAAITPWAWAASPSMRALSTRNDDPTRQPAVRQATATASSWPRGPASLVLEEEEVARARGARIYAELLGYGMSADGTHITAPDEEGRGAARAMQMCLDDARCRSRRGRLHQRPRHQHRPGRPGRDQGHEDGLRRPRAEWLKVSSTKSQLGHLLGASGGVELVASCLAMQRGVLPPTINLDEPRPELRPRLHPQHRPRGRVSTTSCPTASASAATTPAC